MRIAAALDVSPSDMILGDNKDIDIIPAEGVDVWDPGSSRLVICILSSNGLLKIPRGNPGYADDEQV